MFEPGLRNLMHVDMAHAGKAYLCMGQLDEADRQYKRAMELEPGNAAFKAEAQLVDMVRNNLKQGRQCLEEGDARYAFPSLTDLSKGVPSIPNTASPCHVSHKPLPLQVWR